MLNRFKRLWKLSKKDMKVLEKLTPEQIEEIPDAPNGKAVFFGEGTEEEYDELQKEDSGMSGWYKRIRGL